MKIIIIIIIDCSVVAFCKKKASRVKIIGEKSAQFFPHQKKKSFQKSALFKDHPVDSTPRASLELRRLFVPTPCPSRYP